MPTWTALINFNRGAGQRYIHHALPTSCIPVPKGQERGFPDKRVCNGWEFHYTGRNRETDSPFPFGAGLDEFPELNQHGALDNDLLRRVTSRVDIGMADKPSVKVMLLW